VGTVHGVSSILYIDPGVCDVVRKGVNLRIEGNACAHFVDGLCVAAFFAAWEWDGPLPGGAFDQVVIERPHIRGGNTPNAQDIVDLAWDGASLAYSLGAPVRWYLPQQWKGGIPKPAHHLRMWPHLSAAEQALFPAGTREVIEAAVKKGAAHRWGRPGADYYPRGWRYHNLLDAIGLGMYCSGRYDIRKALPETASYERALLLRGVDPCTGNVQGLLHERPTHSKEGPPGHVPPGPSASRTGSVPALLPSRAKQRRRLTTRKVHAR
jgi:hypothetical protein